MAVIKCYRIDHRPFDVGDEVYSPGDHIDRLPANLKAAELMLREVSVHHKEMRSESLYDFEGLERAEKYYLGKQGALYELEVEEADILHKAWMLLVNEIAAAASEEAPGLVTRYWRGNRGSGDYVEILAPKARVSQKLAWTINHKVALKRKHYGAKSSGSRTPAEEE